MSLLFSLFPSSVRLATNSAAESILNGVDQAANKAGFSTTSKDIYTVTGELISVLLGALGIAFVLLLVYAGILYLVAQGDENTTKKAMKIIKTAVMGMVLIAGAYAVANFVISALVSVYGS
ncbi:hypothetical protein CO172_02770 [Candidatus Uhrbacteria bacterium CG_4_9_14_3_um_filter_36_7]|uniref:Uncharacterized protein n=1 Tax=Candidatus Uhrbacteria bacterium CG_4_9_14_3_um_filter_36_7 TaxID=1975033 RepID=A0A2M7XH42_9BACT|nr:MAG: hypothetical protein CO172_02770 [Candidatus Uhrbacteria bacterium CG_4_9_14_3_um_filter_36_7]